MSRGTNEVKHTLAAGGTSYGTMAFEFDSPGLGRLAAGAGSEYIIYDLEHSGWTVETVKRLIATTPANIEPFVRVSSSAYHLLSGPMDVGARGLMVPLVESGEQAADLVAWSKYPPTGRRGAAFGIAHDDYSGGDVVAKLQAANDEGLLIAQIETVAGLESVDAIAGTDGIDVVWVGHFDLTASMGIPAQFKHADYFRALESVIASAERHGKTAGIMVADIETGQQMLDMGFRAIAYSGDLWLYQQALRQGLDQLREHRG